jgi:sugar-specific transcriptional regulator TrmB
MDDGNDFVSIFSGELAGIFKFMRILGVSKKELEVYSLLQSNPGLTANEISKMVGAPTPKVYEALSTLIGRKWVYRTNTRPYKYYAIPVRELWDDIKLTIESQLREVDEKVIPILEKMASSPMPLFRVLLIDDTRIPFFIKRILSKTKNEVYMAISYPELLTKDIINYIRASVVTKHVKVIVPSDLQGILKKRWVKGVEYKVTERLFGSGIIGDEILLVVKSASELNALWSDHAYFIDLGKIYFKYIWDNSSPA